MLKPFLANKSHRTQYDIMGDRYTLLLSSEETGNTYSLFEFFIPKGHGTPPHIHSREDEAFYILSGAVDFLIDGKKTRANAGDVVFGARSISHNFTGASEEPAHVMLIVSPGKEMEEFFSIIGSKVTNKEVAPRPPTDADIQKILMTAPRFGITML